MENHGNRRKRKRRPQQSQTGSRTDDNNNLEQESAAVPHSLQSNNVQLPENNARRFKRSRLAEPYDENRPGTSRSQNSPSVLPERRRTPSPASADAYVEAPPQRANTPPAVTTNDDPDDSDDVIFVGVLQPPRREFQFHIVTYRVTIWEIYHFYQHPANVMNRPNLRTVTFNRQNTRGQSDCRICLSEYEEGEEITTLPCMHNFHSGCANQWLQQSPTCPMCRAHVH